MADEEIKLTQKELQERENNSWVGGQRQVCTFVRSLLAGDMNAPFPNTVSQECLEIKHKIENLMKR